MKTITPQQHAEMMELLDDLAQAVRVRNVGEDDNYIRIYSDEFDRVINLRDSYLAMKAREDERLAHLRRIAPKISPENVEKAKVNLAKGREKLQKMKEDPEFRQKCNENLAKARAKRKPRRVKAVTAGEIDET